MSKTIGILGGMGPLATVDLFKKLVLFTEANCDQDNIRIYIDNNTSIPDRTSRILGCGKDLRRKLIESAKKLQLIGADCIIMPCNTAHYFYEDIVKEINIPFLNMIEETLKYIVKKHGDIKKVGLLATEGTCNAGVYDSISNKYGIEMLKPTTENQRHVTDLIYEIKAGKKDFNLDGYYRTIDELEKKGCNVFILGCTELSVAYELLNMRGTYVDPLEVIAVSSIKFVGKNTRTSA